MDESIELCIAPSEDPILESELRESGFRTSSLPDGATGLIWVGRPGDPKITDYLNDNITWVHVTTAGIESWIALGVVDDRRVWTSSAGAYSIEVGQHAIALLLAGVHGIGRAVRTTHWQGYDHSVVDGSASLVVGAGGIGEVIVAGLAALGSTVTAVNRTGREVPGAVATFTPDHLEDLWGLADNVVLAAPATPETHHLVNARVLQAMRSNAWIVNVGRGSLIDTDALVDALAREEIAGAALDVVDPQPLPEGHALWASDRVIITSHSANPKKLFHARLVEFVLENAKRFREGKTLVSQIDLGRGY